MNRLRVLSIVAPALFVAGVIALIVVFVDDIPVALLLGVSVLAVIAAASLFSAVVFDLIDRNEAGLVERNRELAAVQSAATSIAGEFQLEALLQRFVDLSREIAGARYGALSVIGADGRIEQFITSGLTEEERDRIGALPVGKGLLGVIINEGRALRMEDMASDPRRAGFPGNHPPMRSLLGVPVISRGRTIGNLYLTDKIESTAFTEADEEMVRTFAAHTAVAVDTSRLHDELRLLAVLRERERIGMDLHDGIVQSIYAVGLKLEEACEDLARDPHATRLSLDQAIDQLNAVVRDVRSYIFELRPARLSYDLSESLEEMVREFRDNSLLPVAAAITPALPELGEAQRTAIFHITREALTNARKHARPGSIAVSLRQEVGRLELEIRDDGQGFDAARAASDEHRGLRNMAARARAAGGTLHVDSAPGQGTSIRADIPLRAAEGASP